MIKNVLLSCSLGFMIAFSAMGADNILIADFEGSDFGGWTAEGNAFGNAPSEADEPGVLGEFAARSRRSGTGTLTSPPFTVERDAIYFLMNTREHEVIGGGGDVGVQLLVNDEVVRTTDASGPSYRFHAMFWAAWDVAEFKGQAARFRIFDNSDWSNIGIDHIIQSDVPAERPVLERTIIVTKPVLNFPLKTGSVHHYVELFVDGEQVRAMDVELATDEIDYWVVTDLSPWDGKEVVLRTRQHPLANAQILDRVSVEDGIRDSEDLYSEALRPQFHFSTQRGWVNDPNGLVYYDGEYHLYYQHNPYGWDHSRNDFNKTWGHAVSTDLVHWEELPGVIHPDHLGTIYSGSAVVDENNTTGFQTGEEKPIVAVYTSAGGRSPWSEGVPFSQSIAYSNDRGRTYTPYDGNPVLPNIEFINRDPKAIWHEPTNQWVIVLHFNGRAMAFFTSKDLKTWQKRSELEIPFHDCPELFQLAVDGDEENKKWVLYGGRGIYVLGDFDGKTYTPETEPVKYSYGNCFYASQTFSNVPEEDGRRIQVGWGVIRMEGMPFNQQMLFPVELTLRTTDEGLRMYSYPVEEIESIRGGNSRMFETTIGPEETKEVAPQGELFDIMAEFEVGKADEFGLIINGLPVTYDVEGGELSAEGMKATLKPEDGKIRLRILVDRVSMEIFGNDGRLYMPVRAIEQENGEGVSVFSKGGKTTINSLEIHELNSIWR